MRASVVIAVLLILASSFGIVWAEEHAVPFVLSARFAKATFQGGEPIELLLSLRNSSSDLLQVGMDRYDSNNYRLEIEDQQRQPVKPKLSIRVGSLTRYNVPPKSERQFTISLSDKYQLTAPGKYYVRAILLLTRYWVKSPDGDHECILPIDAVKTDWTEAAVVRH